MKKFVTKSILFAAPFVVLALVEIFALPLDFFTFRVWESVKVDTLKNILPGYFYPRISITKTEQGDITHHTVYALEKTVEWHTDQFGYRNRDDTRAPEIVIIGDSNTVGTGLTQSDTLSVALESRLGVRVYSFAPASLNVFLRDRQLTHDKPRVVIVATIERDVPSLRTLKPELTYPSVLERKFMELRSAIKGFRSLQGVAVPVDRLFKANMLHYYRASVRRAITMVFLHGEKIPPPKQNIPSMHFLFGDLAVQDVPPDQLERALTVVKSYNDLLKSMDIRFIFLPIPNKENIYHDLLPSKKKPVFLGQTIDAMRKKGIETIDLQSAFDEAYRRNGPVLYLPDDTHWSAEGVRIAAELLADAISGKKEGKISPKSR
ncbi:MAG: hypothetical protein LBQ00_07030 [Syntrophobacterales bacterium]|nr:hypothetical protein [Syntrophobacterales bacterium]